MGAPDVGPNDHRRGKVFSVRLTDVERLQLEEKARIAEPLMPYSYERRRGSLGSFVVWAAMQWKHRTLPLPGVDAGGGKVVPARRRRGSTKKKGKARPKGKGKRKAKRGAK